MNDLVKRAREALNGVTPGPWQAVAAARAAARARGEDSAAARQAERAAQVADLVAMFPPLHGTAP